MKTFLKILCGIIAICLVVVGANALFISAGIDTPLNSLVQSTTNNTANAVLDATGIKTKAQTALEANADAIAEKTGLPASIVESIIEDIDIESWSVTSLPANVEETSTQSIDYEGISADITTYDDPSIVTINTGDAAVTLEVPDSAKTYIQYLQYL